MTTMPREYLREHGRIRQERGKASEYQCVDCDKQALDWSTVHDSAEMVPRCRSCHKKYDCTDDVRINISLGLQGNKHRRKLSDDDIREIRQLKQQGWFNKDIADIYGINPSHVSWVCKHGWKEVV